MNNTAHTALSPIASPERILCVLGMHRSGTSCLTGSLQEAGLFLGECHTWNPYNLKGNRENQRIVDINDRVLADNGAAWDRPPSGRVVWGGDSMRAAQALFAEYTEYSPFGFKDPRTLLVLDGWKSLFPHMSFIGIFRHPLAVAGSLGNRNGMSTARGLELWYDYNRRLLREYRRGAFPLLCFDQAPHAFQARLRNALADLGFDASAWQGEFYDTALKTASQGSEDRLPWKIRRLYAKLLRLAS